MRLIPKELSAFFSLLLKMSESSNEIKYQKLLIFGRKGSGKTSLVQKLKAGILKEENIENIRDDKETNQVGNHIKVKDEPLYLNTIEYRILQGVKNLF